MNQYPHHFRANHQLPAHRRGFSLAECAFALLLTAVVIVGALQAISMTHRTRTQSQFQRKSTELAQLLLTEIMQCYYVDPGSSPTFGKESGETRSTYNDVDDYDSYVELLSVKDKSGNSMSLYSLWSRYVDVDWVDPADPMGPSSSTETGLKRIKVTATYITGESATLYGLRSNKGIGELKPPAATTYVEWAGARITLGSGLTAYTSANLGNNAQ